jgi:hypothetical protein
MLQRNELWVGLVLGLLLPVLDWYFLNAIFNLLELKGAADGTGLSANFRERTLAIIAIALNIIPLQMYRRRRWEHAMRGIVLATGLLAMIWLFRFGASLMG